MYLVLMQQKFSPGTGSGHSPRNVYYGDPLFLSEDLSYFVYLGKTYNIKLNRIEEEVGVFQSNAISARKGRYNMRVKKYIYDIDIPEKLYFVIYQTKDENVYLHNIYEFSHVTFAGMRFEMIMPGASNF
jgi:hypothetical protein